MFLSPDLELERVGEEDGINQRIKSLESNEWLNVACGWLNPDRYFFEVCEKLGPTQCLPLVFFYRSWR